MLSRVPLLAALAAVSACAYRYDPPALPPVTRPGSPDAMFARAILTGLYYRPSI